MIFELEEDDYEPIDSVDCKVELTHHRQGQQKSLPLGSWSILQGRQMKRQ